MITVRPLLALLAVLGGCVPTRVVMTDLEQVEALIERTRSYNGDVCAPVEFADAVSDAMFARLAFMHGDALDAKAHTTAAWTSAREAWAKSEVCGGADYDGDKLPDVVDRCPQEAEDFDGINDEDGCPDIDPYGDQDGDAIRNIDDGCPKEPEDFDGHNDDDGCPETSDDTDGDGIIDATDKCPDQAEDLDGFKDADGCPDPDNDRDNIIDIRDACVNQAEDLDDWEDTDGCPEWDNDKDGVEDLEDSCPNVAGTKDNKGCPATDRDLDGISDAVDKCPDQAETRDGRQDDDGCPETTDAGPSLVRLTSERLELQGAIEFVPDAADLNPASFLLLDAVVSLLKDNPGVRVRVEGHMDATGDAGALMALSKRRAETVRSYLVGKGIAADRVTAEGFGVTRPVDTNRTEEGRLRNRRIDFVVIK